MPGPYDIGDEIRSTITIKVADVLTDPSSLTFQLRNPQDTVTELSGFGPDPLVVKEGTGVYHFDHISSMSGLYHWRWQATGAAVGAAEGSYIVKLTKV